MSRSPAASTGHEAPTSSTAAALPGAAVLVVDAELTISLAAGGALTRRGLDPAAMMGRHLTDVLPGEHYARYLPHYRGALAGEPSSIEISLDGEGCVATEFSPVHDAAGALIGAMSVSHDVTETRRAQSALAASERDFRMLAEEASDLISRFAPDGTCLYASPASKRIFGYTPEEVIGRSTYEFFHPDDVPDLEQAHAQVLHGPDVSTARYRLLHKAGHAVLVESTARQHRDPKTGVVLEIHSITRDIGDRLEAESRREVWEQSFAGTTRGICIADPKSLSIMSVNPAFAEMHGGTEKDFVGRPMTCYLPAELHAGLPAVVARVDRLRFERGESEHVRLDGSVFPVRTEVLKPRGEDGSGGHHIAWFEDLTEQREAEAARAEAAEIIENAFDNAPTGVTLTAMDGVVLRVNAALCAMLGVREEEVLGGTLTRFMHPEDEQLAADTHEHLRRTRKPAAAEKRFLRSDGEVVWVSTRGASVWSDAGEPRYIISHLEDITARKQSERLRDEANTRFETAFAEAPIGMALVGLDGRWMKVNRAICELTGYDEEALLASTFQDITHPDDLENDLEQLRTLVAGEVDRYEMEKRYVTAQGTEVWGRLAVSLVRTADGEPLHFISHIEDISERKLLEDALHRLADEDPVTGLWNRRRFQKELHRQVGRCQRYSEHSALLMIDLDEFKSVNDGHGHHVGDDLLGHIATALRGTMRATDALGRIGGDEFAVLLNHVSPAQATIVGEELRAAIAAVSVPVGDAAVSVTASVGIAVLDAHTTDDRAAMVGADTAMYRAKARRDPGGLETSEGPHAAGPRTSGLMLQ